MIEFYDTSALLAKKNFGKPFVISSITLQELENIKTSARKDENIKLAARRITRFLEQNPDKYEVVIHKTDNERVLTERSLEITNDTKILIDAAWCNDSLHIDDTIFVTNDLALKNIARLFFGQDSIESVDEESDDYTGYKEIVTSGDILLKFYQDSTINYFDLQIGEYLILKNEDNEIIDLRVWTGFDHRYLNYDNFNSNWFGKVSPYKNDVYQKLLFDSLSNNTITMVRGVAGSGKSYVSLAYLMHQLERNRIDKIVMFCNTVATANSARLGFYPGSKNEKLLDSQIGNLLGSKLGGIEGVQRMIDYGQLVLLPLADCRGYDTTGMRAGVYITEAQNMDRTLMKLALQRIGEDCICILDGDDQTQVDLQAYAGDNNGMRRASKIFRGHDIYGEVKLNNIYRSKIASIAENI